MTGNNFVVLLLFIYASSVIGTIGYKKFAIKNKILANVNYRTLHEEPTPRGGGLVFSVVFIFCIVYLFFVDVINFDLMMVFGVGSGLAVIIGYIDDIRGISSLKKLILQIFLAFWILYIFEGGTLNMVAWLPGWLSWLISLFFLVWLINAYNFIDGVDGMAITAAILILATLILSLIISGDNSDLLLLFSVLITSCFGFLFFNWPRATVFMGDSGSIFLGYCFGALIVYSTMTDKISFYTWLVVFGYYLGDTTTTTLMRIATVKKWYHTHRSHAYQNLARILENHSIVTIGVLIYHLLWLLPLSVCTVIMPNYQILAVILAFLPTILWTIKFGPLYSNE